METVMRLTPEKLYSLEEYARIRPQFRADVMEIKKRRRVAVGPNVCLYFENELTMQYQIQEMLRLERVFEPDLIQEELDVYNPLIPDGRNWKATMMLEYPDPEERKAQLARLIDIEKKTYIQVADFDRVYPVANEDLDRTTEAKTASVHFLRFELTVAMAEAVVSGAVLRLGVAHPAYTHETTVAGDIRAALAQDIRA